MPENRQTQFDTLTRGAPPRAGHFIVTLYGDVVEPRGGTLWMGRVIDLCQAAGLSETLVRTAVSRLVSAGQLSGERVGRRSYYCLTPKARVEFANAAHILFSPPERAEEFAVVAVAASDLPHGFAAIRHDLALGAYRPNLVDADRFVLRASVQQYGSDLPALVANLWDLDPLAQRYRDVIARFSPLLTTETTPTPQQALIARLLLVDDYRAAILRDPMLPRAALPLDWPGWAARALFVRLYLRLSTAADSYMQQQFQKNEGLILDDTDQSLHRRARLMAEAANNPD